MHKDRGPGKPSTSPLRNVKDLTHRLGHVKVETLRRIYGGGFARNFVASHTLGQIIPFLDRTSLDQVMKDAMSGELERKLMQVG